MDYSIEVRRRFAGLAASGGISPEPGEIAEGSAEDRSLGFWVRFQIRFRGEVIEAAGFQAFGCPHGLAAADLVAEELPGRRLGALLEVDAADVALRLEVPREKIGKILRIEDALVACHRMATSRERG